MTQATVIIPTHDHDSTLPISVRSALAQTVGDLDVMIVGDGPTPEVREIAAELASEDGRIAFLDLPKAGRTGATHWDAVVRAARGQALFYLCDDDLLLPQHVENLLLLLEGHDLVQCSNGWVDSQGELQLYPTELADQEAIAWHLREPRRNCISLTGTAHSLDAYLRLPSGWTDPPPGEWTDHYMWKKFLRLPGIRAATHPEMTTIQLPTTAGREEHCQAQRAAELAGWAERVARPGAHQWLQHEVARATRRDLERAYRRFYDDHLEVLPSLRQRVTELEAELDSVRTNRVSQLREFRVRVTQARARLERERCRRRDVEAAQSWLWTTVLRAVRQVLSACGSSRRARHRNQRDERRSDD